MTKIEWTKNADGSAGETWNPVAGCSIVSPGCTNCYAMKMAHRLAAMGVPHYQGLTKVVNGNVVWTGKMAEAPGSIWEKPNRRRTPTTYFVNSMSDLFHEDVPDGVIDRVFARMAHCAWHRFQILTKRSARMRRYFSEGAFDRWGFLETRARKAARLPPRNPAERFLANVWLGVSAERQKEADERIPDLLATPAAVRFVSAEPLLGPINFARIKVGDGWQDALSGWRDCKDYPGRENVLDQIIVGGESGPGARPMHPDWARSIRDQCQRAGTAFFFKQWGTWLPSNDGLNFADGEEWAKRHFPGRRIEQHSSGHTFVAVTKARAGRLLDGRTWDELPAGAKGA